MMRRGCSVCAVIRKCWYHDTLWVRWGSRSTSCSAPCPCPPARPVVQ